jgi:predicted nuclease of predicted toxin-antitoxin system
VLVTPSSVSILTDNCVPDEVGRYLSGRGYTVRLLRDLLPRRTKDPFIVSAAIELGMVIMTFDKGFHRHAHRAAAAPDPARRNWGLILLDCPKPDGVMVLQTWMEAIELELAQCRPLNPSILLIRAEFSELRAIFYRGNTPAYPR